MKYYKDTNNQIYAFEDSVTQDIINNVAKKHNTEFTQITEIQFKSFKLFGVFDKTEEEIKQKEEENKLDQIKQAKINYIKQTRTDLVNKIIITLNNGKELNGDEDSQDRINRAINGLPDDTTTINWIDYNNETIELTKPELKEALQKAGQAQTEIFVKYNELRKQVNEATTIEEVEAIVWE